MANIFSVRAICERVVVRMTHSRGVMISEMTLDEAKAVRTVLNSAIDRVESGATMAPSFEAFMEYLPDAWHPVKP